MRMRKKICTRSYRQNKPFLDVGVEPQFSKNPPDRLICTRIKYVLPPPRHAEKKDESDTSFYVDMSAG